MSDNIFTEKDVTLLEKSMTLRERIVDNFQRLPDDQLPKKPSELMAVVNLAESIDRSVFQKAKLTIDKDQANDDKATKDVLRSLLLDLHTNKGDGPLPGETAHQAPAPAYQSNTNIEIREGELIPRNDVVTLEDEDK